MQSPLRSNCCVTADVHESHWFVRQNCYLDVIQRGVKTIPCSFDVGFLTGPAIKECCTRLLRLKRAKSLRFSGAEILRRDGQHTVYGTNLFNVNSDLCPGSEREDGKF